MRRVIATQEIALKIHPNDTSVNLLSRAFYFLGEEEKAKELFENLLSKDPNHVAALSVLSNMYYEDGVNKDDIESYKKSIEYNERLIKINPDNPGALGKVAVSYYNIGDTLKALNTFRDAAEKYPDDIDFHMDYGKLLYEVGEKEMAEKEFVQCLELSPDNLSALRNLVRFYVIDVKDFEKGLDYLNTLVELDPENPDTWQMMGIIQANLGNQEEAENAFKKSEELRINP